SESHFKQLLQDLHERTRDFEGPYILSDRRYLDSKVLFYRYGTLTRPRDVDAEGRPLSRLTRPDGGTLIDRRAPYFVLPDWINDPIQTHRPRKLDPNSTVYLKQGRYRVDTVIASKNAGGVYVGVDQETGQQVLLKEARPLVGGDRGSDAVAMLQKEH